MSETDYPRVTNGLRRGLLDRITRCVAEALLAVDNLRADELFEVGEIERRLVEVVELVREARR